MKKILIACVLALLAPPVLAQQAGGGVDSQQLYVALLQPVLMALGTVLAGVVTALAAYAVQWLRNRLGIQALELDAQHREALQAALTNAAGLVLNQIGNDLKGKTVTVSDPAVMRAVQYVMKTAPDALQHFKLQTNADELAQKIIAKVPQVANTTTVS